MIGPLGRARIRVVVRTGVIAGLVLASVLYPVAAALGLMAKAGADHFDAGLDALALPPPPQASRVYAADGSTLLTQFFEEYRTNIPLDAISPYLRQAVVAAEDARFYQHHGVDPKGVARAFVANQQAGGVAQGASTLTMQYVRSVRRDAARTPAEVRAATAATTTRKVQEMRLAVAVERRLGKDEILRRYLNLSYFGHRAYGVSAAAEVFFGKRPADLTLPEAALLAGQIRAPSGYDPTDPAATAATLQRRNWVLDRMAGLGYVTPEVADRAGREPVRVRLTSPPSDCASPAPGRNGWGFFCDLVKSWWMAQPALGADPYERLTRLRRGGYRIVTSLDPATQAAAQRQILARQPVTSSFALGAVAVEPGTGRVRAMAVNRVYSPDTSANGPVAGAGPGRSTGTYPDTVNPLLGGGELSGYQGGSTFKLFTLLAALERGLPLATTIHAPARYTSSYRGGPGQPASCGDRWCPQNASDRMTGDQTMWSAFGKSVNTYFVQLEERVGAQRAVGMAERLGLRWRSPADRALAGPDRAAGWGSFTLGVADTTPLELAAAYATIAADGRYCEPIPVLAVRTPGGEAMTVPAGRGRLVDLAAPRCRQAVAAGVARAAADAARCVTGYGAAAGDCGDWSTAASVYPTVRRPVAGKTGTTDGNRAAWFVGITPALSVAAFIADPDNPRHPVGAANHDQPVNAVAELLREALAGTPVRDFPPPPAKLVGARR